MIPEELNRTIQFIIESQARLAAAQEQDRADRVKFEEWSRDLSAQVVRLIDHQSRRMDRLDKFYDEWSRQNTDFQSSVKDQFKQNADFQTQVLRLLNMILDRLPLPGTG